MDWRVTGIDEPSLEPRTLFDATVGEELRARLERLPPEKQHDSQVLDEIRSAYQRAWGLSQPDKPLKSVVKSSVSASSEPMPNR